VTVVRVAGLLLAAATIAAAGDPSGTPTSREALALCNRAAKAPEGERKPLLERASALAEQAVKEDERDALAHFAVFCTLGQRMRLAGLGVGAVFDLRRLRKEIDRTLELAPDFPGALAGKGSLLLDTPRLLGGDPAEAERVLRRAIEVAPRYVRPRLALARALRDRGARTEARAEAEQALAIAQEKNDAEDVAKAREMLDSLGSGANPA
jgi:tetratricopeptide (TPR) repeat protein